MNQEENKSSNIEIKPPTPISIDESRKNNQSENSIQFNSEKLKNTASEPSEKNLKSKKLNKMVFTALGFLFIFVAILIIVLLANLKNQKQTIIKPTNKTGSSTSSQLEDNLLPLPTREAKVIENSCLAINAPEIAKILPEGADNSEKYNLQIRDHSPDKCHLALNINYPIGANRHQLIQDDNYPLIGLWIIDTSNKKATKLISDTQDYLFDSWVSNRMIDVIGEFGNTITTHNIKTGTVVKKKLNKINLIFNENNFDQMVEFKTLEKIDYCDFSKMTENNWIQYDFSCIEESDVIVKIPGYKEILIQHASNNAIRIDNVLYTDLLQKNKWNINL
jgi:hypothetical protein